MKRAGHVAFPTALTVFLTALALTIDKGSVVSGDWLTVLWTAFGVSFLIGVVSLNPVWNRLSRIGARIPFEIRRRPRARELEARPQRALPSPGSREPSADDLLADRAEHRAAQLRALCAQWDARDEFAVEGERLERVKAATRSGLAAYHGEQSVETMRVFDELVAHGVVDDEAVRGLVEGPRFSDDILRTARLLLLGGRRLRLRDDALAAWLDVHAAVIDRLEAEMRSYAEQEETDAEEVTATNQEFRLTYGAVLRRVSDDAELWRDHIGPFRRGRTPI